MDAESTMCLPSPDIDPSYNRYLWTSDDTVPNLKVVRGCIFTSNHSPPSYKADRRHYHRSLLR